MLIPLLASKADSVGLFKGAATFMGGEGGLLVQLKPSVEDPAPGEKSELVIDYIPTTITDATSKNFVLLHEYLTGPGTLLGRMPTANGAVQVGVSSHLAFGAGRVAVMMFEGLFLINHFDLELTLGDPRDGYGEPVNLKPMDFLRVHTQDTPKFKRGTLTDDPSMPLTRIRYLGMVNSQDDILFSLATEVPSDGLLKQGPFILVRQE